MSIRGSRVGRLFAIFAAAALVVAAMLAVALASAHSDRPALATHNSSSHQVNE